MGRDGTPAREISFVSLVAYGPKVSDSALTMGVTASEIRQGGSQQKSKTLFPNWANGLSALLADVVFFGITD